jgi:DNA-binding transcriptional ArsR family regulator
VTTTVDRVIVALADPTRRQLLEVLAGRPSASATALARELPVSRQALLKHLGTLQESELVSSRREGREVLFRVHPEPLVETAAWITSLAALWDERLLALKARAESSPAEPPVRKPPATARGTRAARRG